MTRRRWIADEVQGDRAALTGEHARHLGQVLRARTGQEFDISTGSEVRLGKVIKVSPERVEFELGETIAGPAASSITVALSIFKFDRMEWAIEKCTELGVAKIVPIVAARTETHLAAAAGKRAERWERIAHAAAEQSRRESAPEITLPTGLKEALTFIADAKIVLSETEAARSLTEVISEGQSSLILAFGPEGGWKQDELDAFESAGWISASLGPTILRTETAAVSAVAIAAMLMSG